MPACKPEDSFPAAAPRKKKDAAFRIPHLTNILLFLATLLVTLYFGIGYFIQFYSIPMKSGSSIFSTALTKPRVILWGFSYSLSLMAILLVHELGHYFACRRHHIQSTLPFFIPAPIAASLSGTFGAIIKIKSPFTSKKSLFDIGIWGPVAGFFTALPILIMGIMLSKIMDKTVLMEGYHLGDSLLFTCLIRLIKGPISKTKDVLLHPLAFVGWFCLLVTSCNLFPIGQLDGGHILYSLFEKKAYPYSIGFLIVLILLGTFFWPGWLLWALLITVVGTRHPPVLDGGSIDRKRKLMALIPLVIFIISFTPIPISLS